MALKLGEMLVNGGIITPAQLDEVLKCQVIFGGKLGTNLIEMGFLAEDSLAEFLSKKLGVPCAKPEQLTDIPPEIIKLIPKDIVQKYKVIPLKLDSKRLTIAITDPTDFSAIDEIAFVTGFIIVPLVSPELRLYTAMERYYDIKRQIRYIPVSGGARSRQPVETANESNSRDYNEPAYEPDSISLPLLSELTETDLSSVETSSPPPLLKPLPLTKYTVDSLSLQLAEANERDVIIDSVVKFLGQEFARVAFFVVKGNTADGMKAMLHGKDVPGFNDCSIHLSEPSVLKVVVEGKSFYLGPIPDTPANIRMLKHLGGVKQDIAMIIPLAMMGRVVSVFFMDGGKLAPGENLLEMQKIVGKAAMAFEILILKNKIMMT